MIDVQFDYRIMTKHDLVIYESNTYSRFLGPKHYIAAIVKGDYNFDCEMYNTYRELLDALPVDAETISKINNLDRLSDKNEVLQDYYELHNPEVRIYMMMSDKNYLSFFLGGH